MDPKKEPLLFIAKIDGDDKSHTNWDPSTPIIGTPQTLPSLSLQC